MLQTYSGDDLGTVYRKQNTRFRLWAPTAERVRICFYTAGDGGTPIEIKDMYPDEGGTWTYAKSGDMHKCYYTYLVTVDGIERESTDPYGRATGVNGKRSMVVDLNLTNPKGFEEDQGPRPKKSTDIVVYEMSVLDTTMDKTCGVKHPGKYLGLTERGTKTPEGVPTGLDHIIDSGITHVQLMPCYDFGSIDESKVDEPEYNWGYDPVNYNVPEGSFSTDPFHGEVRIKEFKKMIQTFHKNGIGVIMDVVYNHTYDVENNCFHKCVPDYYYRKTPEGWYSNASGCGNEVASEQVMVRKYIIDSLKYWATEYHIDGFRFDLMGVLDIETMNQAVVELRKINPSIILYGEGWTGGSSALPDESRALKHNITMLKGIGVFSDDIRDAIRGNVFIQDEKGFVCGKEGLEGAIRHAIACASWAKNPKDIVNYASCHDNLTLWDKLGAACPNATDKEKMAMNRLAAAIVFTAQGTPFFLSGEEFARTKPIEGTDKVSENSYNLPFFTNNLKYDRLVENMGLYEYYKGLIAFRKAHEGLRLATSEAVEISLCFLNDLPEKVVAFTITTKEETLLVVYNANKEKIKIDLPKKAEWEVFVEGDKASAEVLRTLTKKKSMIEIPGISCFAAVTK